MGDTTATSTEEEGVAASETFKVPGLPSPMAPPLSRKIVKNVEIQTGTLAPAAPELNNSESTPCRTEEAAAAAVDSLAQSEGEPTVGSVPETNSAVVAAAAPAAAAAASPPAGAAAPPPAGAAISISMKLSPAELAQAKAIPVPYQEPSWGGMPALPYAVEVIKNGSLVETLPLRDKSFFVIGRLANCDIVLEHPSLSRHHAVLQYKSKASPEKPVGFYLYDLDSTHGSFHNKNRCFPKTYYRLRVGHMLKFGGSTRTLILQGPEEDSEAESELSITELKALSQEKARKRQEEQAERERKLKEAEEKGEEQEQARGVSWGMMEDAAEEFPDMEQNPFAETADNESMYIDDPRKALAKWFEREGCELEYQVEEKGYAQFLCKVELPVDTPTGESPIVEALVKGKKKDAMAAAALDACRMLDRLGLLKPTNQSAREKKVKQWEEDDFYASDEDEFLDRTGSIEQKRRKRMKMAGKEQDVVETFESLSTKHAATVAELATCEQELGQAVARRERAAARSETSDLDSYVAELRHGAQVDKETVQKLKMKIIHLKQEKERLVKLINIARPASMPALKTADEEKARPKAAASIMIGKRGGRGLLGRVKNMRPDSKAQVVVSGQDTRVLEAFLAAEEESVAASRPKKCRLTGDKEDDEEEDEDELQPIGYEARPEPAPKLRIGDTLALTPSSAAVDSRVAASGRVLGPTMPDNLKELTDRSGEAVLVVPADQQQQPLSGQTEAASGSVVSRTVPMQRVCAEEEEEAEAEATAEKKTRGDRGSRRRKKPEEEEEEEKEEFYKMGMDSKYDVWVPPAGQSGDGRTSLNEKLGY